ncbi:NAD(P)/FAD-dependent oxidoreductase [Candidatus Micrarchaeota archaeon]|nr:NAD(P)/FAD-dependent oxidoreductase [Candidatus Micrarchaeota archaeon]
MASVHVVGAGPAGCIAAINAIGAGHSVFISEEHGPDGFPKNCSGLFSIEGLETLKKYVDYSRFVINGIRGADIYFDDVLFKVRRKEAVAYVCNREGIDKSLAMNAEGRGAKIFYGERITGNFRSNNIIGADGANSVVAENFEFPRIGRYVATLQRVINYKKEENDTVDVYLSSKIPGFFGWIIPHSEERAEVGVGVELPNNVRKAWNHLLKLKKIEAENPHGSVIPVEIRKRAGKEIGGRRVVLVGDAAGQTKATTGGGVIFGAWCAEIAGREALKPRWYDLEWRARYGHEFILHRKIRDYMNGLNDRELREFGEKLNRMDLNGYLEKHGNMDKPSGLLKPEILGYLFNLVPGFGAR